MFPSFIWEFPSNPLKMGAQVENVIFGKEEKSNYTSVPTQTMTTESLSQLIMEEVEEYENFDLTESETNSVKTETSDRMFQSNPEEFMVGHRAMTETLCYAVEDPHDEQNVIPRTITVSKNQANASLQNIHEIVNAQLNPFENIRGSVFFVPSIPSGRSGRIMGSMIANMATLAADF